MLLKQMFCKHKWERETLGYYGIRGKYYTHLYGCVKCGKLRYFENSPKEKIWRRKREFKGDTFIDKGAN